jgi:hypothetical protein
MGEKNKKFLKSALAAAKKLAPKIVGALGGPFGGLAEGVLENVLGINKDEAMEQIAAGNPEVFANLKIAELEFEEKMKQLDIEEQDLYLKDVASARSMRVATKDWTPGVLTGIALTFFFTLTFLVLYNLEIVSGENRDFAFYLFGVASGWVTQGMNFFLGSSRGSQKKTEILANGKANVSN